MEVLESLSQKGLKVLSRRVPDTHVEKGRIFYTPGEQSEKLFMLKKGRARLYTVAHDGRELTLAIVDAGQVFGEVALTAQQLRRAYAEAMEPVVVCAMNREQLEELVRDKPEVGIKLMGILSEQLSLHESRTKDIGLKEVLARPASLILRLIDSEGVMTRTGIKIPNRYAHEHPAAMIGSERETVTRAISQLQELGTIELKRRKIHIGDQETPERTATLGVLTKIV